MRMISAKIHFRSGEKDNVVESEDTFEASSAPEFVGLMLRPSPGLWEFLKAGGEPSIEINGKAGVYRTEFSLDVGENTFFFFSPAKE